MLRITSRWSQHATSRWSQHAVKTYIQETASLLTVSSRTTKNQPLSFVSTRISSGIRSEGFHSSSREMNASLENGMRLVLALYTSAIHADMSADLDPYAYTSGRWLRNDKLERDARFIKFNFDALCKRVVELCPGAGSIESCEKKEGGFNRVFVFTCDNARRVVAKLPTMVAGPPRLTTNSEVATITYCEGLNLTTFKRAH